MSIRRLLAVSVTLLLQGNPWTVAKGELAWKVKGVKMQYMQSVLSGKAERNLKSRIS